MSENSKQVESKGVLSQVSDEVLWYGVPITVIVILLSILGYKYGSEITWERIVHGFDDKFLLYFGIGVFAQLVDGTLGMGYGATSTSFLVFTGVPPKLSSMGVHVAEMFTTGVSAISHHKFGNINRKLAISLVVPGVLGALFGTYLLSNVFEGDKIKPYITLYMMVLAGLIIYKAFRKVQKKRKTKNLGFLALFGGFMDSVGGGGWGPIVTSTLIGQGRNPKYTIGSVNVAEFAIAFASGVSFLIYDGISGFRIIAGLILGGVVAAPIAAYMVDKIPRKPMQVIVGILIIVLSLKTIIPFLKSIF
ncbi:MAG: sulfite exporter TauE/SafE family protein [Leadbetterella sp.]